MIAPALLALAVTVAAPTEAPGQDGLTGWRHELMLGAHTTNFASDEGSHYAFHSAALGYAGSVGALGPFLRVSALLPFQARQDGAVYATANYYRRRSGADLLVGGQKRWTMRSAELEVGPGFHATLIDLPGRPGYRDFTALPMGLGVGAALRWHTGAERLARAVTLAATASVAYDFRDPAHANDLAHGFTLQVAVALGLGGRR